MAFSSMHSVYYEFFMLVYKLFCISSSIVILHLYIKLIGLYELNMFGGSIILVLQLT